MMEYLIVNLGIFIVIAMAAHFFLPDQNASTPIYELDGSGNINFAQTGTTGEYGQLGNAFLQHFNITLRIVSLPFP